MYQEGNIIELSEQRPLFLREGVFGSLSKNFYRTLPNYSHRKTTQVDGPEILRRCREDQVDAALLTPV